jgi:hypothetical protein
MLIGENSHLTYCTNIHPGETWEEVFESLKKYCVAIKNKLAPEQPFGIGLRLSQKSASQLLQGNNLPKFKKWLDSQHLYIFTMNGFPYGDFHNVAIKDKVHLPDWTTEERVNYTNDLIKILSKLLPENIEGGISTSPLSYKLWFNTDKEVDRIKMKSVDSLISLVIRLVEINKNTGKLIHIDLEPEPDGLLENTQEVIDFYDYFLLKYGIIKVKNKLNCTTEEAKLYILDHIQLCYDVCHFALAYEHPKDVITQLQKKGIKIGKIQISAALKCVKSTKISLEKQQHSLRQFDEPTYLHQAVIRTQNGDLKHFSDLTAGIKAMNDPDFEEIRTHFHVPVFISNFEVLDATQNDIINTLDLWKKNKFSAHLEVETYTWTILPEHLQTDISRSIVRELEWVQNQLNQ